MASQKASLAGLPVELQLHVASFLDYPSAIALWQSNKLLHEVISPQSWPLEGKVRFVHAAELFTHNTDRFGCFRCFRVLGREYFADNQVKNSRAKGNSQSSHRFCLECAREKSIYSPGSKVVKSGTESWVCPDCRELKEAPFCHHCGLCQRCTKQRLSNTRSACPRCGRGIDRNRMRSCLPACPITAFGMALRMVDFEEQTGMIASPEWFDGDDFP